MAVYNANDIIGKSLIAKRRVNVYSIAKTDHRYRLAFVKPGNSVGIVKSFIQRPDGIWWEFDRPLNAGTYYVKQQAGAFDISNLQKQGVLTVEEKAEQARQEELSWYERLLENTSSVGGEFRSTAMKAGAIILAISLLPSITRVINATSKKLEK
jgi:hypothetical protein